MKLAVALVAAAVAVALPLVVASCTPQPPNPPPQPDADAAPAPMPAVDASPPAPPAPDDGAAPAPSCTDACAALAAAGCPEGRAAGCVGAMLNLDAKRLVRTPSGAAMTCAAVAGVRTPSDARALGIACGTASPTPSGRR